MFVNNKSESLVVFRGVWLFALFLVVLLPLAIAGGFRLELDDGWVIRAGDDAGWAEVDVDRQGWRKVDVGVNWEDAGLPGYDGFAWYRLGFVVPAKLNRPKELRDGFLVLSLGYVDDVDVTYFNGVKVGSTGSLPPDYSPAYKVRRNYRIPLELIRWGKSNVIAVRVYDGAEGGGLYDGAISLRGPVLGDLLEVSFEIGDSDGIYHSPEAISVGLKIANKSISKITAEIVCTLKSDLIDEDVVIDSERINVEVGVDAEVSRMVMFRPASAGFYKVTCTSGQGGDEVVSKSMMFGYDPDKFDTPLTREDDFDEFWVKCRRRLDGIRPQFKVTKSNRSTDDLNVYLVEMRSYGNVRVRGWYTVPAKGGPHAAILSVPGYNSTMWPNMYRKNVATFALNPRGHGNSKDDIDPKGAEYMYLGFDRDHPEKYIYAGAYMDCVRAVDFLMSRDEIDKKLIGVEGGSQGGGLSFAVAALDERIMFCAADIPWLGDWVGYVAASDWPREHYPELIERFDSLTFDDINRLLSYFDTMNLADRIKCPVLMSVGLQDAVCPPRNSFATYNAVRSKKEYRVYPLAGHGVYREHGKVKNEWIARMLGVGEGGL